MRVARVSPFPLLRCAALLLGAAAARGAEAQQRQPVAPAFERRVDEIATHLMGCDPKASQGQPGACTAMVARGLHALYGVSDFGPDAAGRYHSAAMIRGAIARTPGWRQLGSAESPEMLDAACTLVNEGSTAVVAVSSGHVVLLLPGTCRMTTWGRRVPLAASYVANRPVSEAFIGLPLSQAWPRSERANVQIWARATR